MARLPKFLADRSERHGFAATVTDIERPSPGLLRLTFEGEELRTRPFAPCDVMAFRISDKDFRHYTPETVDHEAGRATILFHLHGPPHTPGLRFVEELKVGSATRWCGMASARAFRWTSPRRFLAMGDVTALGLMVGLTERARAEESRALVVVEVEEADAAYVRGLLPEAVVLAAGEEPGQALRHWLTEAGRALAELSPTAVYLAGHGGSVQEQRALLRGVHGLDRRLIHTQPFWATGKVGL